MAVVLTVPNAYAADYTREGKVDLSTAGTDLPPVSYLEVALLMGGFGVFSGLWIADFPLGKIPTIAAGVASLLVLGAYRKELWDGSEYDYDHGTVWTTYSEEEFEQIKKPMLAMVVERGTVRELLGN